MKHTDKKNSIYKRRCSLVFLCLISGMLLTAFLHSNAAASISAMTTRPTDYYLPTDMSHPEGSLPPGFMITIEYIDQPLGYMEVFFQNSAGEEVQALIRKDSIEPSFYETPEPIIEDTPIPTVEPTPSPTPLPVTAEIIELKKRTPAYHTKQSRRIIGHFPAGAEVVTLSNGPNAMVYVTYSTRKGKTIRALCRAADIKPDSPTENAARSAPVKHPSARSKSDTQNAAWFENYDGWKQALSLQRKTKQKMLIYFYFDWSDDCKKLADELLMTGDFIKATKNIIKLRIAPDHGKQEAQLANKYEMTTIPTLLVSDKQSASPRKVRLLRKMYGSAKVMELEKAVIEINAPPPPPKPKREKQPPKHWKRND